MVLDDSILDPRKHSTVVFKENVNPNNGEALGDDITNGSGKKILFSKLGVQVRRFEPEWQKTQSNIRNCGVRFKLVGTS